MTGPDRFPTETEAFVLPGSFDQEPQPVDLRRDVGGDGAPSCQVPHRATVAEVPDRGAVRDAGHAIERESLRRRDGDPLTPGAAMTAAGGAVHWARDGAEANLIVGDNLAAYGVTEALKTEPLTTDELGLTGTPGARRIEAIETDLTPFAAAEGWAVFRRPADNTGLGRRRPIRSLPPNVCDDLFVISSLRIRSPARASLKRSMCPAYSEFSKVYAARIEDHGGSSVSNINLLALAVAAIGLTSIEAHAEKIDLTGFKLTFDEEFDGRSISQTGATTTWADIRAANRYDANSDIGFGKSSFLDSASGYDPFAVRNGALTITGVPYTVRSGYPGSWQSGLIHSRQSFVQSYGYFEMRAKFNSVPGTWPAFWLLPATTLHPAGRNGSLWQELDVVEQYGAYTQGVYSTIHTTQAAPSGVSWNFFSSHPEISSGFHTYGMDWEPATIKYYVDGVLMGTKPTPDDMAGPMYVLVDLARDTPYAANAAAMTMDVDYVRAFSKDPNAVAVVQAAVSTPGGSDPGLYGATSAKAPPADVLTLSLYEDAYKGDCEFTVSVDGAVIGGVRTTTGTKAQPQSLSLPANLARGAHKVTVNFLNDIYEGQGKDRNLFMAGLKVDGVARYGFGDMGAGGPHTYAIQIP